MPLIDFKCTHCGADLPENPPGTSVRCQYCGHTYEVAPPPEPARAPLRIELVVPERIEGRPAVPVRRARSGVGCLPVIMLLVIGLAGFAFFRAKSSSSIATTPPGMPAIGGLKVPTTRQLWDDVGGAPLTATVGGREKVFGRMRMEDDQLYVVEIDAASTQVEWRFGPLGTYGEGYRYTHFAFTGGKLVVTDFKSTVHVFDPASHKELGIAKTSDRVETICTPRSGSNSVWVGTIDKHGVMLDLQTFATKDAPRPATCDDILSTGLASRIMQHKDAATQSPKVASFQASHVYVDGDLAVVSGYRSPGTATPWAVGFDPKTLAVRWNGAIPSGDASTVRDRSNEHESLAGGRFVTTYGTTGKGGTHIAALDARTGAHSWDIVLPTVLGADILHTLVASANYVYVARSSSLDIYDARNGSRIGVIGTQL